MSFEGARLTTLTDSVFKECGNLASITIPESVTRIERHAFYKCSQLTPITLPAAVTEVGQEAFRECTSITSVILPASVSHIGDYAFYQCSQLHTFTCVAGSSLQSIGSAAFQQTTALASITLPASVSSIGDSAFDGTPTNLQCVIVPGPDGGLSTSWNGAPGLPGSSPPVNCSAAPPSPPALPPPLPIVLPESSASKTSSRCNGDSAADFGETYIANFSGLVATHDPATPGEWVVSELPFRAQCTGCELLSCSTSNPNQMSNSSLKSLSAWACVYANAMAATTTIDLGPQCRFASGMRVVSNSGTAYSLSTQATCSGGNLSSTWSSNVVQACQSSNCASGTFMQSLDGCEGAQVMTLEAGGHCGGAEVHGPAVRVSSC